MTISGTSRSAKREGRSRQVAAGGVGLALAVALPMALHPFGLGPVLLPMHFQVLVTGGFAGPVASLKAAVVSGIPGTLVQVAVVPLIFLRLTTHAR